MDRFYCRVCAKPIKEWEEVESRNLYFASYHGKNWYKHRDCFCATAPPTLYHRGILNLEEILPVSNPTSNKILGIICLLQKFGSKILYWNSEECKVIYPDNLPEKVYIYTGENTFSTLLLGGLRPDIMATLPDTLKINPIPEHMFRYPLFSPTILPIIKGGFVNK